MKGTLLTGRSISFYLPSILYKIRNLSEIEGHRRKNTYFSDQIKIFYIKGKSFYQDKLLYVLPSIIICTSFYFSKMSLSHISVGSSDPKIGSTRTSWPEFRVISTQGLEENSNFGSSQLQLLRKDFQLFSNQLKLG